MPERASGRLTGHEVLRVTLDVGKLDPENAVQGNLVITETDSGRTFPVDIAARVSRILDFLPPNTNTQADYQTFKFVPDRGKIVFNVEAGGTEMAEATVLNRSDAEIAWKAGGSLPWVRAEPSGGRMPPQSSVTLRLAASPPDRGSATYEAAVEVVEAGGPGRVSVPVAVHVISPYRPPQRPEGVEPVPLDAELFPRVRKAFRGAEGPLWMVGAQPLNWDRQLTEIWGPRVKERGFQRFLSGGVPYEITINLEGAGFTAFSAEVGFPAKWSGAVVGMYANQAGPETDRFYFEIYVDGKLQTESGAVGPKDDFRLLVARGLENAKELRLVARPIALPAMPLYAYWFDPTLYKGK
jgi:hypothetical protein